MSHSHPVRLWGGQRHIKQHFLACPARQTADRDCGLTNAGTFFSSPLLETVQPALLKENKITPAISCCTLTDVKKKKSETKPLMNVSLLFWCTEPCFLGWGCVYYSFLLRFRTLGYLCRMGLLGLAPAEDHLSPLLVPPCTLKIGEITGMALWTHIEHKGRKKTAIIAGIMPAPL